MLIFLVIFFLTPVHWSHTLGRAASWKRLSDSLTWWNGLHHGPQTHTGPSRWVNLKIKFSRHGVFKPVKTWFTSKAGSKHGQKDRSFLLASAHPGERRGPRCPTYCTWGHSDLFSRIQVPARAQLFYSFCPPHSPAHYLYCQALRSSLAYSLSITIRITKGNINSSFPV